MLLIPIQLKDGTFIELQDIASVQRSYKNKNSAYGGIYASTGNHSVSLVIYKANRINIFSTAASAKKVIEETYQQAVERLYGNNR